MNFEVDDNKFDDFPHFEIREKWWHIKLEKIQLFKWT
jgi:hypothetical protein